MGRGGNYDLEAGHSLFLRVNRNGISAYQSQSWSDHIEDRYQKYI